MRECRVDADLIAYAQCMEKLEALEARVEDYLLDNHTDRADKLVAEMRDLGRRLRDLRRAIENRAFLAGLN